MGDIGVILIIIYYIYNNLIWVGRVTHFLCGKCAKCGKCYPSAFCQMPTMLIYAKIAAEYGISEERVRKIVRSTRPPLTPPRPSKSPKIHPKNQRFFGDPGKGDFVFPPFKGGAGRVLSFLGVLAQQTAKKCSTFAANFKTLSP